MTVIENSFLALDLALWVVVIFIKAAQPARSTMSSNELQRRANAGDRVAANEIWRNALLPRVTGLKWLVETLTIFAAITILFQVLKPVAAILMSVSLLLVTDIIATRTDRVRHVATRAYQRREAEILARIEHWGWLEWFRRTEALQSLHVGSREELVELIERAGVDIISRDDRAMLVSQLAFSSKTVADVMTPRTMIDYVEMGDTIGPLLLDRLHRTGHSRFPVISDDIDHVVGMLYMRELIGKKSVHETVKTAMSNEVFYIGEHRSLEHALHAFLRTHHHLFIVVNEYRETVGILSLEDVIEALIGRTIIDEFDEFDDLRSVAATNPKSNNAPKGKKDI